MKSVPVSSVSPELLRRIRTDAVTHFGLEKEPQATAVWLLQNPYSRVFCIQLAEQTWTQRVFAKVTLLPFASSSLLSNRMRTEFNILSELSMIERPRAGAGTVVPFGYYSDIPSVVTVEAPGPTLRKEYSIHARLIAQKGPREALVRRVALCGDWLRAFHERTSIAAGGLDLNELASYCEIRLSRLHQLQPRVFTAEMGRRLLKTAAELAVSISCDTKARSGRHNDFASHNIIACHDGGVRVLDFTMYDQGPCSFDVCNFWFELEMLKYDPSYLNPFLSELQSVFLAAYETMAISSPEFLLARFRYSINRLLNAYSEPRVTRLVSPRWHLSTRSIVRWLHAFSARVL